ncbi:hypothetical protein J2X72_000402 [Phyllobacterium sp. 1468]|nr:hypothetical protein [Phyllobacterium sp. 1468]
MAVFSAPVLGNHHFRLARPDSQRPLEQVLFIQSQFCFPDGETIHTEGGEADVFPSDDAA